MIRSGAGAISLAALAIVPEPAWLIITLAVCAGAARGCHTLLQATAVSDRWAAAFGSYTLMGITMAGLLVVVTIASAKT